MNEISSNIIPVILTYNEEKNIYLTLKKLAWADQIIVLDSYSNDKTIEIINSFSNTTLHQRVFDNHSNQWNFALDLAKEHKPEWVLALDADYVLTNQFVEMLPILISNLNVDAYSVPFKFMQYRKILFGNIYPNITCLFRPEKAIYIQEGHTQRLRVDGEIGISPAFIIHDDKKSLSRWLQSQISYTDLEAQYLVDHQFVDLNIQDKLRKMIFFAPLVMLFYCLIFKGLIFSGLRGIFYTLQKVSVELLISVRMLEKVFFKGINSDYSEF